MNVLMNNDYVSIFVGVTFLGHIVDSIWYAFHILSFSYEVFFNMRFVVIMLQLDLLFDFASIITSLRV